MPCKHEGGTDKCRRYKNRVCIKQRRSLNSEERKGRSSSYISGNCSVFGYTLELLVAADLNVRVETGFAYLNPVPFQKDDVFVKTSVGWRTVQVKACRAQRRRDGSLALYLGSSQRKVTSDILALVSLNHMCVRYIGLNGKLPPEITTGVQSLCRSSNLTAVHAKSALSNVSVIATSRAASSVTCAGNSSIFKYHAPRGSKQGSTGKEIDEEVREAGASVVSHTPEPGLDAEVDQ